MHVTKTTGDESSHGQLQARCTKLIIRQESPTNRNEGVHWTEWNQVVCMGQPEQEGPTLGVHLRERSSFRRVGYDEQ